jgi:hypothetical protein
VASDQIKLYTVGYWQVELVRMTGKIILATIQLAKWPTQSMAFLLK